MILNRKQTLKSGLIDFATSTETSENIYSVSTDINKGYWVYRGVIYRMVIIENSYENASPLFKEGNAICGESYTIETVKEWAKNRINNALKQI